jgi:nucleoside-diphosphate-sugar epimerase
MQVLLTGAASMLGGAVAAALAADGYAVRATDAAPLLPNASEALAGDFWQGALTDPEFVAPLLEGVHAIVHLAPLTLVEVLPPGTQGRGPGEVLDAAARGTHVLLKAAVEAGAGLVVQGSTLAMMDAYDEALEITEQWRPRPRPTPAELAPYLAELTAREFTRDVQLASPLSIVCLRFGALVDGAGGPSGSSAAGGPSGARSLHVADAAHAVLRALAALPGGARQRGHRWQLYHIASLSPDARYTSAAAQQALGYAPPRSAGHGGPGAATGG